MTGTQWLLVAAGAAVGAPLRYLVDAALTARVGARLPWGTLAVNLAGSLLLGLLAGRAAGGGASADLVALVGTGFCGAFTTASAFAWEVVALAEGGGRGRAAAYAGASLLLGVGLAVAGLAVGVTLG